MGNGTGVTPVLLFWRKDHRRLAIPRAAANPVADVEESDEEHERNEQHRAGTLEVIEKPRAHAPPANGFDQRQQDVSAVEHWERQHVEQREVYVEDDAEPQHAPPAVVTVEESFIGANDHHGAAELLDRSEERR